MGARGVKGTLSPATPRTRSGAVAASDQVTSAPQS